MRVIVMFDLPTDTSMARRHYRWFRKFLINEGFAMMQEYIYTKICLNMHSVAKAETNIRKNRPPNGLIQVISVTERQFANMKLIIGEADSINIQSEERMIIL